MTKVLFTYDYGESKMRLVEDLGYEIINKKEKGIEYNENLKDVEVLVCYNPFQSLDISKMKKLKLIQLSSIGIDQAPLDYIKNNGITISNNKGGYSIPMGEWIVLKVLESYKDSKYFFEKQLEKDWEMNTSILEVYKKTIGFIGTGTIAVEGAKRLQGFDMNIYGLNTDGHSVKYFDKCFKITELNNFLSSCDIIVCTLPHTEKTHHIININAINSMKDDSVLINVSRGSVIDEKALVEALNRNKFRSVALDVFEKEPLPKESELWDFERVYISPHNSWISEMRNERRFETIFENLKRYSKNEELLNVVKVDKGY